MSALVLFSVDDGDAAIRVEAVLCALGFEPIRDLSVIEGEPFEQAAAAAAWRYRLSSLERELLRGLLRGLSREQLARSQHLSEPTTRFHLHNLHHKLGVDSDEQAVRRTLHLEHQAQRLSLRGARETLTTLDQAS